MAVQRSSTNHVFSQVAIDRRNGSGKQKTLMAFSIEDPGDSFTLIIIEMLESVRVVSCSSQFESLAFGMCAYTVERDTSSSVCNSHSI